MIKNNFWSVSFGESLNDYLDIFEEFILIETEVSWKADTDQVVKGLVKWLSKEGSVSPEDCGVWVEWNLGYQTI
jgi:hypothetical protein